MFKNAIPVWAKDREKEINVRLQFKAVVDTENAKNVSVKLATSGTYNLFVNGEFVSYGPARAGKDHFRVDEYNIDKYLNCGKNVIVIEVSGYYVDTFYIKKHSSFLMAEVFENDNALLWTGEHFTARVNPYYIQKMQRLDIQRGVVESYKIDKLDSFLTDAVSGNVELVKVQSGNIIPRYAKYPEFEKITATYFSSGTVEHYKNPEPIRDRSLVHVPDTYEGFPESELEFILSDICQDMRYTETNALKDGELKADTYSIFEFPYVSTGNLTFKVNAQSDMTLYVIFDEVLTENYVNFIRMYSTNAFKFELKKGEYDLRLFEVYAMKYVQFVVVDGSGKVSNVGITEYKHPKVAYNTDVFEDEIKLIADAAIETYRQNSVDLYTDCPSRERAGWLCDSFFTSRVEYALTGGSILEKNFLENFLHEENYEGLPEGMLPMCYPADHFGGVFIPQWAMWLVIELEEYLARTNDRDLIDRFENKILNLLKFFEQYENSDGLLESLPSWNFVEWSRANDLTQDVNYPTNMLYTAVLNAAGRLYNKPELFEKSELVKNEVLKQSFNGSFFIDNAVRENGELKITDNCTEVCQYYAFFFSVATKESHPELWKILNEDFGPDRDVKNVYPDVFPAEAFIGNYLRLDTLMRYGEYKKVYENIKGYFGYMAKKTGTLWEFVSPEASCDHGFASYVICWLDELKKKNII